MKIKSNFTDYYDRSLEYGIDESLLFKRITSSELMYVSGMYAILSPRLILNSSICIRPSIIGFCGELYKCVTVETDHITQIIKTFYNFKSFIKYFEQSVKGVSAKDGLTKRDKEDVDYIQRIIDCFFKELAVGYRRTLEEPLFNEVNKELKTKFVEYKVPYFCLTCTTPTERNDNNRKYELILLPRLNRYDFVRVKNPTQAFQEISMFIGGVLGQPANTMIEISNKDMAIKKGFGHKYAFRKEPQEK